MLHASRPHRAGTDWRVHAGVGFEAIYSCMKQIERFASQSGKIGYVLLWLLGIPLPILLLIYLIRG
jgi:hypothetical protein